VATPAQPALTLGQLASHLWEAANILRGPVDAADFKTYVFPLLFFKRISDAHDEEYEAALKESGGDEEYARFPQNYRFQIPEDCHWRDVRAVATNVGQALQTALPASSGPTPRRSMASSATRSGRTRSGCRIHYCAT
jgi:type I restriction enzyme M protein